MTPRDLFDETFGQLDPTRLAALDRATAADPDAARRRQAFRAAIAALVDDDESPEPPADLTSRTLALIQETVEGERARTPEFSPPTSRFRWADFAVAAVILIASVLSILPPLRNGRIKTAQLGCIDNLRQIGLGLSQYAVAHNVYPYVSPDSPASYVGSVPVLLHDSGQLPSLDVLDCPAGGCDKAPEHLPTFHALRDQEQRRPGSLRNSLDGDYAFSQGLRDPEGRATGIPSRMGDGYPLVADQPPYVANTEESILDGNSPNHSGRGQNVLFVGGHVQYRRNRWLSKLDSDLYLNEENRVAPGLHQSDGVLTPAVYRFQN